MKHIFVMFILMFTFSVYALGGCSDADKKALEALDRAWGAAGLNGDKAALAAIYADDYVGLPAMIGKAQTMKDTLATYERNKGNPPSSNTTFDHYLISCTPVTATITHRNTTTAKGADGRQSTTYSRSVHVLEKRGGKWQAVSNAGNNLDDTAVLWYLEQDWNNALMKRDRGWFDQNYASDFSSISSTSANLTGKTQEISDIVGDRGLELAETTDMNIRVDGNLAIVTGVFRTMGKDDKGAAYDRRTRYTDTWIKRDGRWQAWASQGTIIPAAPMQTARN
jgi:ketosteroid isomerase-like protein